MNKNVTFTIEGDYITDISRQRLQEGSWKSALKILDCIDGLNTDQKFDILTGKMYLSGSNDLSLEEDTRQESKEYKDWIAKKCSGVFLYDGKQYEPYAVVDSWCDQDLNHNIQFNSISRKVCREFETKLYDDYELGNKNYGDGHPHGRSLHYADNPEEDLAFIVPLESSSKYKAKVVLFKRMKEEIPFFMEDKMSKSPLEAIETYQEHLDSRGAKYEYQDEDPDVNLENILLSKDDFLDESYIREQKKFEDEIENYKKKIIEFADNDKVYGWKVLEDDEGRQLRVPGRAFLHYSIKAYAI